MAKITIFVPEQDPIELELDLDDREKITVGRAPDCDIVVEHASISGNHAVFELAGDSYTLSDLGSTNGTFVEGAAIGTDSPLANGMHGGRSSREVGSNTFSFSTSRMKISKGILIESRFVIMQARTF